MRRARSVLLIGGWVPMAWSKIFFRASWSSRFTMLGLLMFSLAMGSNFRTLHSGQPQQQHLILCAHQLSDSCQGNAFLQSCDIIQQSNLADTKHLPTLFHSSFDSIIVHREPHANFTCPPPFNGLSPHFTAELLISASLPIIHWLETSK